MSIALDWNSIIQGFVSMYETSKNAENTLGKQYAVHAEGMLKLIPQIRHFDEFKDIEFGFQLGKLVCRSKIKNAQMSLSFGELKYYLFIHDSESSYSEVNYDSDQIVAAIHHYLKQITTL